jgi:hypothetical protein
MQERFRYAKAYPDAYTASRNSTAAPFASICMGRICVRVVRPSSACT